jgi:hypothetical protein
MKKYFIYSALTIIFAGNLAFSQSPEVGKEKHLIYHDIQTDAQNFILPWYNPDPAISYDHVLELTWNYWNNIPGLWMRNVKNFKQKYGIQYPPLYLIFRTQDPADLGIGGGQFAQMLSSFDLYYNYSGNQAVLDNMIFQADWYINHGFSDPSCAWPNIPYPCNTEMLPVYDGDLVLGKGYTQPDKAGDFGYELVTLFKKTGNKLYLETAIKIANTLAAHTTDGDRDHSPIPFKVNAKTGEIGFILDSNDKTKIESVYSTNWTCTMRLFQQLIGLHEGNTIAYQQSFDKLFKWLMEYPVKNNRWGPFFEDIRLWSDTQINAGLMAWFIMDNQSIIPDWKEKVQSIQKWVIETLGVDFWKQYGLLVIGEQSVYKVQGQSHTSRHASIELRYAELTGDNKMVDEAIRQLNWCTYPVDFDGKNRWPNFDTYEIWWSDGYGDYMRHYLRSMASMPSLCPAASHLLRSTSVIKSVEYKTDGISYNTYDPASKELIRVAKKPSTISVDGTLLIEAKKPKENSWTWEPMEKGGVLKVNHTLGTSVVITL